MIITERNTKKFKDIVNTIIVNRGEEVATQRNCKQKYNFNLKGEIKPIRIGGVTHNDVMTYYWVVDGSGSYPIRYVSYSDYTSFVRDSKISSIIGEEVEIVSKVRKSTRLEFNDFTVEVGMELKYNSCNVVITKITPKTFKFKYVLNTNYYGDKEHSARIDKCGRWSSNGYYFRLGHYTEEERAIMRQRERDYYYYN